MDEHGFEGEHPVRPAGPCLERRFREVCTARELNPVRNKRDSYFKRDNVFNYQNKGYYLMLKLFHGQFNS